MAAERKTIATFADGVEYLKKHGKYADGKFKLEKSNVREFYELANAPKPVQEAMAKADELLRGSIWRVGTELLKEEVIKKKNEGASVDELKQVNVQVTALGDSTTHRVKFQACKDIRIPQTNEIVDKFGPVRFTIDTKRTGVTKEDADTVSKELQELINGK